MNQERVASVPAQFQPADAFSVGRAIAFLHPSGPLYRVGEFTGWAARFRLLFNDFRFHVSMGLRQRQSLQLESDQMVQDDPLLDDQFPRRP
jgi:hypothetical protein